MSLERYSNKALESEATEEAIYELKLREGQGNYTDIKQALAKISFYFGISVEDLQKVIDTRDYEEGANQ